MQQLNGVHEPQTCSRHLKSSRCLWLQGPARTPPAVAMLQFLTALNAAVPGVEMSATYRRLACELCTELWRQARAWHHDCSMAAPAAEGGTQKRNKAPDIGHQTAALTDICDGPAFGTTAFKCVFCLFLCYRARRLQPMDWQWLQCVHCDLATCQETSDGTAWPPNLFTALPACYILQHSEAHSQLAQPAMELYDTALQACDFACRCGSRRCWHISSSVSQAFTLSACTGDSQGVSHEAPRALLLTNLQVAAACRSVAGVFKVLCPLHAQATARVRLGTRPRRHPRCWQRCSPCAMRFHGWRSTPKPLPPPDPPPKPAQPSRTPATCSACWPRRTQVTKTLNPKRR